MHHTMLERPSECALTQLPALRTFLVRVQDSQNSFLFRIHQSQVPVLVRQVDRKKDKACSSEVFLLDPSATRNGLNQCIADTDISAVEYLSAFWYMRLGLSHMTKG